MTTFTKTEIMERVSYWASQAGYLQRRAQMASFTMEEFIGDIERINRGLHQLLGDIEREIYDDRNDQTETRDYRGTDGDKDRQHYSVVSELASE